jgi:hypothetical protein
VFGLQRAGADCLLFEGRVREQIPYWMGRVISLARLGCSMKPRGGSW